MASAGRHRQAQIIERLFPKLRILPAAPALANDHVEFIVVCAGKVRIENEPLALTVALAKCHAQYRVGV